MIELSREMKYKRVFGVLGMASRNNSRNKRLFILKTVIIFHLLVI
jgi:hypothetical protein